jgi:lia operon protein LiaG
VRLGILRMIVRSAGPVTGLAMVATLAAGTSLKAQEQHSVSGGEVAIYNLAGRVTIEPGSGSDVMVQIDRGGADADQLRIETGVIRGYGTLRVVYPSSRVVAGFLESHHETKVRVRDDGTFSDNRDRDGSTRVTVTSDGNGLEAWAHLTISVPAGKTLAVYLAVGRIEASNIDGDIHLDTHSAPVTARSITGSLNVDVGSGSVEVSDVSGTLSVDTGSGSVRADRITGEVINIDTGSGGVTGNDLTAQKIDIDTGSGSIDLDNVSADRLGMDTGSGGIDLTLVKAPTDIDVDTGSGSVTIRSPQGLNAAVDLETGSGTIESDFPMTVRRHSRDHVQGQIGDGSGRIKIDTGSGSIRLLQVG